MRLPWRIPIDLAKGISDGGVWRLYFYGDGLF